MSQTRSNVRTRLLATVTAIGVLAAACGDDSADGDGGTDAQQAAAAGDGAVSGDCADEVAIGAVWPQTGAFAFAGEASLIGARLAVDEINEAGGIASLCDAPLKLVGHDAGATAESAASAVETLLTDEPDVSIILGSWLSSLTLSATEISEREQIPWISDSFADEVTERSGFEHVYGVAPPSSLIKDMMLEAVEPGLADSGQELGSVAVVGDNTAAAVALHEALLAEFDDRDIDVAVNDQWAPGLDDASGIAARIASNDVDAVFLISFSFADVQLVFSELRSRGVTAPIIQNGGQGLLPAWQDLGDDVVGMSTFVGANPVAGGAEIAASLSDAAGEDFARQDHLVGYFMVQVAAAAIEEAGSVDTAAINDALKATTFTGENVVSAVATTEVAFDESGRIANPFGVLAQWQQVDGELRPCTVWPADFAECEAVWEPAG